MTKHSRGDKAVVLVILRMKNPIKAFFCDEAEQIHGVTMPSEGLRPLVTPGTSDGRGVKSEREHRCPAEKSHFPFHPSTAMTNMAVFV